MKHATTRLTAISAAISATCILASPAAAELRMPDCDALASWSSAYERGAQWKPNNLGTRYWFPPPFAGPETEKLFGAPVLAWSVADARAVAEALKACERELKRADRLAERNDVHAMRGYAANNVARYLEALGEAREAVAEKLAALEKAPASIDLLRFYAALAGADRDRRAFNAANQAAGQLQEEQQVEARALMAALKDLPQGEIGPAVSGAATARMAAMRGTVRDGIVGRIDAMPATLATLQLLATIPQRLRNDYAGLLTPEDLAAITKATGARAKVAGEAVAGEVVGAIGAVKPGAEAFQRIDALAGPRLIALLPPEESRKVEAAAAGQRRKAGDVMLAELTGKLASLPESQDSIDLIDTTVLPAIAKLPGSAAEEKQRFVAASTARRGEILAAVNQAERGPLRGRVYAGGGIELEFVDPTRVFMKQGGGMTVAGTYSEEADGRVVVTINGQSIVLTREGRVLEGGPAVFKRTK